MIKFLQLFFKSTPLYRPLKFIYQILTKIKQRLPIKNINIIEIDGSILFVKSYKSNEMYFFPYSKKFEMNCIQAEIMNNSFYREYTIKYSHNNCHVQTGDVVVDCGGFVGGFSLAASKMGASKIFHIEPTPLAHRCAKLNFLLHEVCNIELLNLGLGESECTLNLQLSKSAVDNSFLPPDDGSFLGSIKVPVITIDKLAQEKKLVAKTTFFKIEAEGFEIEIIKGMQSFLPSKIVVDITPERNGLSPAKEISTLLIDKGYEIVEINEKCLFAIKS